MQFWALMVDGFRESRDRKVFWVMLAISLLVSAAMACVGFEPGRLTILFGAWEWETDLFTSGGGLRHQVITSLLIDGVMDNMLGWVGILLAIVATAGFFPAMMERGTIDVLVSKPLPRWKLFFGRYFGALTFLLFHATVFVGLTFLVAGLRWNTWVPGYWLAVPLVLLLFSYLYCISVLVAVHTRSTVAALLITLGCWGAFTGVQTVHDYFLMFPEWQENRSTYQGVTIARWLVPKTQDVTYLAKRWTNAAPATAWIPRPPDEDAQDMLARAGQIEAERMRQDPLTTIASSLGFEAVIVLLALWRFSRKDF